MGLPTWHAYYNKSMNTILTFVFIFIIIFVVPIIVYALFTKLFGLPEPKKKARFFVGIVIQKLGTTFGFLALFMLAQSVFNGSWLWYAVVWFAMFAVTEIGQTFMPGYSKKEAVAGIISEAIYFPAAAWVAHSIL